MNLAFIPPFRQARFFFLLARHLQPDVRCSYYSRRRVIRNWARSAGCQIYPNGRGWRDLPLDMGDEELRFAVGPKELELRADSALKRAPELLASLADYLDRCAADALLVWNGSELTASLATYLARRRRIPVLFGENGYLPGTVQIDAHGVNYDSALTDAVRRGEARMPPQPALDVALDEEIRCHKTGRHPRAMQERAPAWLKTDYLSFAKDRSRILLKEWRRERVWRKGAALGLDLNEPLPDNFLLVPLQVRRDSQLILHSPLVRNDPRRLLEMIRRAVADLDPTLHVVVKLHPREKARVQSENLQLLHEFPEFRFTWKAHLRDLLPRAAAVVTINSTVGFEALMYDKPVVALGRNFYVSPDLVEVVEAAHELPAALQRALSQPVRVEARRAFLRYVHSRFLVHGHYQDYSAASLRAVAERIRDLLSPSLGSHTRSASLSSDARVAIERALPVVRPHVTEYRIGR